MLVFLLSLFFCGSQGLNVVYRLWYRIFGIWDTVHGI